MATTTPPSLPTLDDEQLRRYRTEGYVVLESVFSRQELDTLDRQINRIAREAIASGEHRSVLELEPEQVDGQPRVRRIYHPFDHYEAFARLAGDVRITGPIQSLIGPDIAIHHSKLNMKPARVGSIVEWHQDLAYFPHTNDDLVTTLVYLDDANEHNGCLQVLPRHHSHYFDHTLPDGMFAGMITETIDDGRFGRPVPLAAPAGSVIFMHCLTPHASLPNQSDRDRRTLIFEYRAADAFPIYFGAYTEELESHARHLVGQPTRTARFGGPAPVIPRMSGHDKSLYTIQDEARKHRQKSVQ